MGERAQFNPGVIAAKLLNANGKTSGAGAQVKLTPAKYIFEGAIAEAGPTPTRAAPICRLAAWR